MKHSMTRFGIAVAAVLAVSGVGVALSGGQVAAQGNRGANPLSSYIGRCVAMTISESVRFTGELRSVSDTHAELTFAGYPFIVSLAHTIVTTVDTGGPHDFCSTSLNPGAAGLLGSIESQGR